MPCVLCSPAWAPVLGSACSLILKVLAVCSAFVPAYVGTQLCVQHWGLQVLRLVSPWGWAGNHPLAAWSRPLTQHLPGMQRVSIHLDVAVYSLSLKRTMPHLCALGLSEAPQPRVPSAEEAVSPTHGCHLHPCAETLLPLTRMHLA